MKLVRQLVFLHLFVASSVGAREKMDVGTFLWMSDVHLDGYYGTSNAEVHKSGAPCQNADGPYYSAYGCGSSRGLLDSALHSASQALPTPDFILYTGDSSRHNSQTVKLDGFNSSEASVAAVVNEAMSTVYDGFQQHFPGVPIVELPNLDLGNNDLLGDYQLTVTSDLPCLTIPNEKDGGGDPTLPNATNDWLIGVADRFQRLFVDDQERAVFACGGYMNRRLPSEGLRLISLNTIVWTLSHEPKAPNNGTTDPFGQHAWLRLQLESAKAAHDKVYLTGHVPPMLQSFTGSLGEPLWQDEHVERFFKTLVDYSNNGTVAGIFFAHVHSNELRAVPGMPDEVPPMMIAGSMAPCYTTTPFYSFVRYDRGETKFPLDLVTYNLNLAVHNASTPDDDEDGHQSPWERMFPSLTAYLGLSSLTNGATKLLAAQIASNASRVGAPDGNESFERYFQTWYKGVPQTCDAFCRKKEACLMNCGFTVSAWESCVYNNDDDNNLCSLVPIVPTPTPQNPSFQPTNSPSSSASNPRASGSGRNMLLSAAVMLCSVFI